MKIFIAALLCLAFSIPAQADRLTLTNTEAVTPAAAKYLDWYIDKIDFANKTVIVAYRRLDSNGTPIQIASTNATWRTWTCKDVAAELAEDCTDVGVPYPGCTGNGTGSNLNAGSTCFTDTMGFEVRQQDVGVKMGVGLRTLLYNKFKAGAGVISSGNTGAFDE